jgi:uncharacterized protein (TIGR03437 family)
MLALRREAPYIAGVTLLGVISGWIVGLPHPTALSPAEAPAHPKPFRAAGMLATLPLWFEENLGQTDAEVRYVSRGRGYALFLTPQETVLSFRNGNNAHDLRAEAASSGDNPRVLRMKLTGRQGQGELRGEQPQAASSHYFRGNDPSRWRPRVPHYSRVRDLAVYAGIDLVYYGAQGSLEFDFVVAPGADPRQIEMEFSGQQSLSIEEGGQLVLELGGKSVRYERPLLYQEQHARQVAVSGRYQRRGPDRVGFELAANYDPWRPLIIDPVLNYSTFLGDTDDEQGVSIAVDSQGNSYITGTTQSSRFPTTAGAVQPRFGGPEDDVFVAKLNPIGDTLVFSTFLGANSNDRGRGIAIGSDGSVYVAGETESVEFPVTEGVWQKVFGRGGRDAFVAKISADGSRLVYSTFIGSNDQDWATDVGVDTLGQAHVTGGTRSSEFPTTPLAPQTLHGDGIDAFLVKMKPDGSGPVFSTFLGGGSDDEGSAIALDPFNTIYVTGYTDSDNFPVTAGAFQPQKDSDEDAFVVKIFDSGAKLAYSSFLGGNGPDFGNAITIDSTGNAYVTGFTRSNDLFRTPPVFQNDYNGSGDAFLVKIVEAPRLQIQRMTYLGTSEEDTSNGVVVWNDGSVTVAGHTKSANFPVSARPIQEAFGGGDGDAFVATVDPLFRQLTFSTFLGGEGRDEVRDLARDDAGSVYVAGVTSSRDFPVTGGALQETKSDGDDVFVLKISETLTVTSVSAASFDPNAPVAANSIASAFGPDLAPDTAQATTRPLPTELLGVRLNVIDSAGVSRGAALFFVSPRQINFLVPEGTVEGAATVEVSRDGEVFARGAVTVRGVAPALFAINAGGQGVAAGQVTLQRADGSRSTQTIYNPNQFPPNIQPIPVDIGSPADQAVLVLFGTGIRATGGAANVTVAIGDIDQQVLYAGDQMQFAGLDQLNVLLSPSLAGRGLLNIRLTAGGRSSNIVTIQVQ